MQKSQASLREPNLRFWRVARWGILLAHEMVGSCYSQLMCASVSPSGPVVEAKCVLQPSRNQHLRKLLKKEETAMTGELDSVIFFAPETLKLSPGDAFFELAQELSDLISRRAYELFESKGFSHGHDREDWLQAASEILLNVPVDVKETETELTIRADVPGFNEKDLEVRVTPRSVCILGKREEAAEQKEGNLIYSERRASQIFRVVSLSSD